MFDSKLDGLWTSLNNELKNIKNEWDSVYESSIALLKKKIIHTRLFNYISLSIIIAILIRLLFVL